MSMITLVSSLLLGVITPLTAPCVIALYPGYISYLTNRIEKNHSSMKITLLIVLGIITFLLSLGLIFSFILQKSLTRVVGIISPIAYIILLILGVMLMFGKHFNVPVIKIPKTNPYTESFLYGLFFGAIIIPCNPAFIGAFLARQAVGGFGDLINNILNVSFFGFGMGLPLVILSVTDKNKNIIKFVTKRKHIINVISGLFLVSISIYYLVLFYKGLRGVMQ